MNQFLQLYIGMKINKHVDSYLQSSLTAAEYDKTLFELTYLPPHPESRSLPYAHTLSTLAIISMRYIVVSIT